MEFHSISLKELLLEAKKHETLLIFSSSSEKIATRFFCELSSQEKTKSSKFLKSNDRHNYIVAHGLLRLVIGDIYKINPKEVKYYYGKYNKPFCKIKNHCKNIYFNLSHSGNKILIGISKSEIGVDIEIIKRNNDILKLSELVLTNKERNILNQLDSNLIVNEFYRFWALKESLLKATGHGLNIAPKQLELSPCIKNNIKDDTFFSYYLEGRHWDVNYVNINSHYASAFSIQASSLGSLNSPAYFEVSY